MHGPHGSRRAYLALQTLESRDTPAGTVHASLAAGVLTLTGDDFDNSVLVSQSGQGTFTITPLDDTAVIGGPDFNNVNSIVANLADGNDTLQLTGPMDFTLTGAVTANLGDGDNVLDLSVPGTLQVGGLTISGGDGKDLVTVAGGAGKQSTVAGNMSVAFGIGRGDMSNEFGTLSHLTVQNLDVLGFGGLKFTAGEGNEELVLQGVNVSKALSANGGAGSLWLTTTGGNYGSIVLNSVGFGAGNPYRGIYYTSNGSTTVSGAVTLTSRFGIGLDWTDMTAGPVSVLGGPYGTVTADFKGTDVIHGNLTVRGTRLTVSATGGSAVTLDGDLLETASGQASLTVAEASLAARNISVTGGSGVDFYSYDSNPATNAQLTATGAMTFRAPSVQYDQTGGVVTVRGRLALFGTASATFRTGVAFYFDAVPAKTTAASLVVRGRTAWLSQTESEATFAGGLSVIGSESATFQSEPRTQNEDPNNPGVFDSAAGAKTTVAQGTLLIRSSQGIAEYYQHEGVAEYGTLSVLGNVASLNADVGDGFMSVGPKLSVTTGPAIVQGGSADFFQMGGESTFAAGLSVVGSGDGQFVTMVGETHDPGFNNFFDLPPKVTVTTGPLKVNGGTGDVHVSVEGEFLKVGGDLLIGGAGHNRLSLDPTAGTTVDGSLRVSGANGDPDWFGNSTPLTVGKDLYVSLGGGVNSIGIGGGGGNTTIGGNLTLLTGDGSDDVTLVDVMVQGSTTIHTGAAADSLAIVGATTFNGLVTVDLGGGADVLGIAHKGGASAPVTFNANATVKMGAGNDTAYLGIASDLTGNAKVVVGPSANLTVDGGLNLDTFDPLIGKMEGTVTPLSFELPAP